MPLKISIIIPAFNSENTISETLESIISQTYKNVEVIIMDAVSTDKTRAIASKYAAANDFIKLFSEPDKGVYDAMNKAIPFTTGDYLYFMGSDDVFFEDTTLENIVPQLTADVIYGNVKFKHSGAIYSGKSSLGKLTKEQISICHQAIFYSRKTFDNIGNYNLEYFIHADYDFNIRCFADERITIRYVNQIIAIFNESGLSGMQSNADDFHTHLTEKYVLENTSIVELYRDNLAAKKEISALRNSRSYRLGSILLSPFNFFKRVLK